MRKANFRREIRMIPLAQIDDLSSHECHKPIRDKIAGATGATRLREPIAVTPYKDNDGSERFQLLFGEGKLHAFRLLGETHIPARVVAFRDDDDLKRFLTEQIAHEERNPLKTIAAFEAVRDIGYGPRDLAEATGMTETYAQAMFTLLEQFEERFHLIEAERFHEK